jgi:phosphotransferase system, enzyme I, PtsP
MREAVQSGLTAEAAVERVQSDNRARMLRQSDPYLRDRLHDLDDLANRLLRRLVGQESQNGDGLPENAILVARSMGPAALLDYDRARLRGVVLEEGGPTSHIAIVARALGIPAVGEIANATSLCDSGDAIIVDGLSGEVQIRPTPEVEASYAEMVRLRARRQEQYRALRDVPAVTRDGVKIGLHLNAGLLVDLTHLHETGAEGVGLFRTELQFMIAERMPSAAEQQTLYEAVYSATGDLPVTIRTLDIGGDKILPYMPALEEENPALGWRAIRIGLDRPALLRVQLRALLKAAAGRPIKIMFPMVATVEEFIRARDIVDREKAHLRRHGYALPSDCRLGAMVEVPSLLFQIDEIAREADFLSVGSNDLMQFLFAVDRENRRVANRFDPLCGAAMRAFRLIAERSAAQGCPATVCGEIGGRPLEALALIGLGFRDFSMSPASIGPVKAMVLSADAAEVAALIQSELTRVTDGASVRPALAAYAKANGVPI